MIYQRLRNSHLAWQLINAPSRLRFWFESQRHSPASRAAVHALREQGIATVHISELFPPEVFDELRRFAEERWRVREAEESFERRQQAAPAAAMSKNLYLVDLWDGAHVLDLNHPFLRWSLSNSLLAIVNGYLGMFSKFREFFLQVTIPTPRDIARFASQRWHADPDDRRMVKVFLYLNDVDASAGPFTYIRGSQAGGKWRRLFPYAPKRKSRHPDPAFIHRMIPEEDIAVAIGKAGTIIFCDTSGIHRGGYATAEHRIMYTSVYTTRASFLPTRFRYPPDFRKESCTTAQARYAVDRASL